MNARVNDDRLNGCCALVQFFGVFPDPAEPFLLRRHTTSACATCVVVVGQVPPHPATDKDKDIKQHSASMHVLWPWGSASPQLRQHHK